MRTIKYRVRNHEISNEIYETFACEAEFEKSKEIKRKTKRNQKDNKEKSTKRDYEKEFEESDF